jgi:hypothetical protein
MLLITILSLLLVVHTARADILGEGGSSASLRLERLTDSPATSLRQIFPVVRILAQSDGIDRDAGLQVHISSLYYFIQ